MPVTVTSATRLVTTGVEAAPLLGALVESAAPTAITSAEQATALAWGSVYWPWGTAERRWGLADGPYAEVVTTAGSIVTTAVEAAPLVRT